MAGTPFGYGIYGTEAFSSSDPTWGWSFPLPPPPRQSIELVWARRLLPGSAGPGLAFAPPAKPSTPYGYGIYGTSYFDSSYPTWGWSFPLPMPRPSMDATGPRRAIFSPAILRTIVPPIFAGWVGQPPQVKAAGLQRLPLPTPRVVPITAFAPSSRLMVGTGMGTLRRPDAPTRMVIPNGLMQPVIQLPPPAPPAPGAPSPCLGILAQVAAVTGIPTPPQIFDRSTTIMVEDVSQQLFYYQPARTWCLIYNPCWPQIQIVLIPPKQFPAPVVGAWGAEGNIQIGPGEAYFWATTQNLGPCFQGAIAVIGLQPGMAVCAWESGSPPGILTDEFGTPITDEYGRWIPVGI